MATHQPFPLTHWSLVKRAGLADASARKDALQTLLERYVPALRTFLWVVMRYPKDEAEEVLQAFIADQVLDKDLFARADQSRGRFRTLLLRSLQNYAIDVSRRNKKSRRETPAPQELSDDGPNSETIVLSNWARTLINGVIVAMKNECERSDRRDVWLVFEERLLQPIFSQLRPPSYEDLAMRLKLVSPTQAANLLITAKRMYVRLLRAAVGEYELEPEAIDDEIIDLWKILAASPAFQERSSPME